LHHYTITAVLASSFVLLPILPTTLAFAQAPTAAVAASDNAVILERTEVKVELQEDLKSGHSGCVCGCAGPCCSGQVPFYDE
jgi:hypothetical protein